MESVEILLVIMGCVMVSSVFDQLLTRVTIPLVQIAIGLIAGFFISSDPTTIFSDPELFLLIFIAPLLFNEARHADKASLWHNKGSVISLAIGLVIVTCLVVGFILNLIVPSIPLAAAFALGAALGPTDAVAVMALGKDVSLSKRQNAQLSGEALINDASGVVSFDFAIAAAVTGAFSLVDATVSLVVEFFGGIAVGLVLAAVVMFVLNRILSMGLETPTVYVLMEVCTPFVAFLMAETVGVSGVLSVVAAGLFMKFYPNNLTTQSSRYSMASASVWDLISYVVNGAIFVLLGMKLPQVFLPTWNDSGDAGAWLIGLVLLVTFIVMGVRFLWILGMDVYAMRRGKDGDPNAKVTKKTVKDTLATTLSGPKGAVTLSIVLTIPYTVASGDAFPNRDLLIFIASGTIICTLLLASFIVPVLAPSQDDEESKAERNEAKIQILQNVINELLANQTPENETAVVSTVAEYRNRINLLREEGLSEDLVTGYRMLVLENQLGFVMRQATTGQARRDVVERYAGLLNRRIQTLGKSISGSRRSGLAPNKRIGTPFSWFFRYIWRRVTGNKYSDEERAELAELMDAAERHAVEFIDELSERADDASRQALAILRSEHSSTLHALDVANPESLAQTPYPTAHTERADDPSVTAAFRTVDTARSKSQAVAAEALTIELEQISMAREQGKISPSVARDLRNEVYVLQMGLDAK